MVKNKKGGSGHKKMARKNVAPKGGYNRKLRLPKEEGEIIAQVTAISGGGHAVIKCTDGKERTLVIRGKFRGRNKRDNTIRNGSFVLAGLRSVSMGEVINPKKKEKADILEVYPESAKKELLSKPEVYALLNDSDKKDLDDHDNIVFTNEILDTSQEEVKNNEKTTDLFKKDETEFDWDDI
jgi:initiation factor 1A